MSAPLEGFIRCRMLRSVVTADGRARNVNDVVDLDEDRAAMWLDMGVCELAPEGAAKTATGAIGVYLVSPQEGA